MKSKEILVGAKNKVNSTIKESKDELFYLLNWTWPVLISNILNNVIYMFINMAFIGRLGTNELGAVALGNTWTFCTSSIVLGSMNAMDTFISQGFGAKNYRLIGTTVQRSITVTLVLSFFVSILWFFTKPALILIHQNEDIARLAEQYVIGLIPGLFFGNILTIMGKYLQGMGIMKPSIAIGVFLNIFNAIFNFIFVHGVTKDGGGMGVIGSSLATSLAKLLSVALLYGWIIYFKIHKDTWFGFSREAFDWTGIKEYLKLAIPAGLQLSFEGMGFELMTVLSSTFGAKQLDAHSISMNFTFFTFMIPMSISIALSVRIGQLLGQKDPKLAKKSTNVAYCMTMFLMGCISIVQYSGRHVVGKFYTPDKEVQDIVSHILPIAALFQFFDGFQTMSQGVIRGTGKNNIGAIVNFVAFYCIGVPISCIFGFAFHLEVYGLWYGLAIGLFGNAVILGFIVLRINWDHEVKKTIERTASTTQLNQDIDMESQNIISSSNKTLGDEDEKSINLDEFEKFNQEEIDNPFNNLLNVKKEQKQQQKESANNIFVSNITNNGDISPSNSTPTFFSQNNIDMLTEDEQNQEEKEENHAILH